MSSLVTSASVWTNEDNNTKKRQATMRKTIKLRSEQSMMPQDMDETTLEADKYGKMSPSTVEEHQEYNNKRNYRINSLLDKMTTANTGESDQPMGDFKPMTPPSLNVKKDMDNNANEAAKQYIPPMPSYLKATIDRTNMNNGQASMMYGLDGTPKNYSNYQHIYEPPKQIVNKPYYASMGIGASTSSGGNDKLMEKINYMIRLLEENQNEKTSNITEEFILYTFLGIFIIFIVDSFSRSGGKYIR